MDIVIQGMLNQFRRDRDLDLDTLPDDDAFEAFAGYCVLSGFYEEVFEPTAFRTGGGNDLGIDAFGVLVNGQLLRYGAEVREVADQAAWLDVRVVVVQAKTSPRFETKVISDLADNLCQLTKDGDVPYPTSPDVDDLRDCLRAVWDNIGKLTSGLPRLYVRYVTTGETVAEMVTQKARQAEQRLAELRRFETVDFRCVTQHELREWYQRATTAVSARVQMPKKVPLPPVPGVTQALLGLVSAPELVDQVLTDSTGSIRRTLFHENVRDFQGYNEVNRRIRDTLQDGERRDRFAVLNNGVTIVTRELTVVGDEIALRDFQVVNGCQTCHVLFEQRELLTDAVQVSVRVVHSQDDDVIGGIVEATNRQTEIKAEDLAAREHFHRRLEDYFAAQEPPRRLYYERRSKQYGSSPEVEKTRIVSRAQLTRAYAAMFLDEPAGVGHYQTMVERRRGELFQDGHPPEPYYAAAAAWYRLEWLFRNRRIQAGYRPARYHLLAAIKLRVLGRSALPHAPREVTRTCQKLLAMLWDPNRAERLVALDLVPVLQRAIDAEPAGGAPLGEMVRTRRFADRVRDEVLGSRAGTIMG